MSFITVQPSDYLIQGKLDVGKPGASGGLDVGEGGSYSAGLVCYTYDASATSGSRFTAIADLKSTNVLSGDVGDRLYFGHVNKFWGARVEPSVAKTTESYIMKYWNGSALITTSLMGILKDDANSLGEAIMEQTSQKEYITWDRRVNDDWVLADNQLNTVPNSGTSRYWVCIEVPTGGFVTSPTVTELKIRGSDFDIISGAAFPVFWGRARTEQHERLEFIKGKGTTAAKEIDIVISATSELSVVNFDSQGERTSFTWVLPDGIDTSCSLEFTLTYMAKGIITPDIRIDIKKLKNATVIGSGETSDLIETTSISVLAANTIYSRQSLVNGNYLVIQDLNPGDTLSIDITRTDSNTTDFNALALVIHYTRWTSGEHV